LAANKIRALGINIEVVTVGDDVSVGRERSGRVGRRALAGTVLVQKIAGAMAARATSTLKDVRAISEIVIANLATTAASLNHTHVPGRSEDELLVLQPDELELGMGIHNEPGCRSIRPIPPLKSLVKEMLDQLLDMDDTDRAYVDFRNGSGVVLMINNLGGLSILELGAITKEVISQLSTGFCFFESLYNPGLYQRA
jgi:dihydroxyacetone kinase